ncbi:MAG: efflux RND transporter periplasmic adaptor subunit [Actinomycetota bacterium]
MRAGLVTAAILVAALPAAAQDRPLRGLLVPRAETALSSQVNAVIAEMPLRPGQSFRKGDLLVRFDCSVQEGQRRKAEAELDGADKTLAVKTELKRLNSVSELELGLARAEVAKARADMEMANAVLRQCTVKAPFDGRVVEVKAHAHEAYQAGQKLMDLVDDGLEIEVIVPSRFLEWLKPGSALAIRVDETGRSYDGAVAKLGARVDPVSQSVKVYGALKTRAPELLAGMSGEVSFPDRR